LQQDIIYQSKCEPTINPEKLAQRDLPALRDLMEVCCLWNSILEPIRLHVGDAAALGKLDLMFKDGKLGVIRSLNQNRVQFELKSKPNFIHAFENSDVSGSIEKFNHVSNHKKNHQHSVHPSLQSNPYVHWKNQMRVYFSICPNIVN
jgi:hypothetical protein